jgi:hypothetical protein
VFTTTYIVVSVVEKYVLRDIIASYTGYARDSYRDDTDC